MKTDSDVTSSELFGNVIRTDTFETSDVSPDIRASYGLPGISIYSSVPVSFRVMRC